jgi:hypothetical protein
VRVVELGLAGLLAIAGIRSLWTWSRRRFESTDIADHLLYALYLTGRVGLWFSLAGFFVIYAWVDAAGASLRDFQWYGLVPLVLAGMQLVAGWFLGHREARTGGGPPSVSPPP